MSNVLVINSGSSSFKYQLIDMDTQQALATGLVERIGQEVGYVKHKNADGAVSEKELPIPDHTVGFQVMISAFDTVGPALSENTLSAVGHRVVHGGDKFATATIMTEEIEREIERLFDLAPLHNPANLEGIRVAKTVFPSVPQVAIFDTAFHQTLAPEAYTYAIDADLAKKYNIRRYGFHGTSHKFVSEQAALFVGKDIADLRQIILHLGNGASACAVRGGKSVETSMGLTPLEGLVMGTRSGDIDPAVLFYLARRADMTIDDLDNLLNRQSGMLGLTGYSDLRDVWAAYDAGDPAARLGVETAGHRIRQYIGAYIAVLGGVDVITFTAGVGENDFGMREEALKDLEIFGIHLDLERNNERSKQARRISTAQSKVQVLVIPTNEELEIAKQCLQAIA